MIFNKKAPHAEDTPPASPESLPLRERLSQAEIWPTKAFGERFANRPWTSTNFPSATGNPWPELPLTNRCFLVGTGFCLLWLVGRLTIPPVYRAGAQAVFPYTAAGKQQTCLDNLRAIQQAVSLYAQDNNDRLPPLDTVEFGHRATWVSLVLPRTTQQSFQCPTGPTTPADAGRLVASYVLNPVLALHRLEEADNPYQTLLLADGGDRHDVSLLPPFPSWPSFAARPSAPTGSFDAAAANLSLRHWNGSQQVAGAIYADSHAEPLSNDGGAINPGLWGGSMVARSSLERLESSSPQSKEFVARLRNAEVAAAGRYYASHRKALNPVSSALVDLWKLNRGEHTSDSVQAIGWNLARAMEQTGDRTARKQLDTETSRRMDEELSAAKQAGLDVAHSDQDFDVRVPRNWTKQEETVGRYTRTYFRSASPDVFAVFEVGQRVNYSEDRPVDWGGMARDLRQRYGSRGYKLIHEGQRIFYYRASSVWEYEVEKPGSPRLRKLYIGYVSGFGSHVAAFTAPAKDFEKWRPIFEEALTSFTYQ